MGLFSFLGDIGSSISSGINAVENTISTSINSVISPIETTITSIGDELGSALNTVISDVGSVASSIEGVGETFVHAVGAATSSLAAQAAGGLQSLETAADNVIASVGPDIEKGLDDVFLGGMSLSQVESELGSFAKQYGHALIDVAADSIVPGSSVLIDVAWSIAENGKLPSFQDIAADAANAAVGELMPGMDEAIGDELPGILDDMATGAANSALDSFAADVADNKPAGEILSDLENQAEQGALGGLTSAATAGANEALKDLLDGSGIDLDALKQNIQIVTDTVDETSQMLVTAQALAGMSPAELVALGVSDDGLAEITQIGALAPGQTLQVDVAQALALSSVDITFVPSVAAQVKDTAASLEQLSADAIGQIASLGVRVLQTADQTVTFDLSQVLSIIGNGVRIATNAADLPRGQGIIATCGQITFERLTSTQLMQFKAAGFNYIDVTDTQILDWDFAQASSFAKSGLALGIDNTARLIATAAQVTALTTGKSALTPEVLSTFIAAGVSRITIKGSAASMLAVPNAALAVIVRAGISDIGYTIADSVTHLVALTNTQIKQLKQNFAGSQWSVSDKIANILKLTSTNLKALSSLGVSAYACYDSAINVQALAASDIALLATNGATSITVLDGSAVFGVAQEMALQKAGLLVLTPAGHTVSIADTAANLAKLDQPVIAGMAKTGITSVRSKNTSTVLKIATLLAFADAGIAVHIPTNGTLTVSDTVAAATKLDAQQIQALSALGVRSLQVTGSLIALTLGQCFSLSAASIAISDRGHTIEAKGTSFDLKALTPGQVAELPALGITQIALTGGTVALSSEVVAALEYWGITLKGAATATCSVLDSAASGSFLRLSVDQIAGLAKTGISTLKITAGVLMTVAQAEAIADAGLKVVVAPAKNAANDGSTLR